MNALTEAGQDTRQRLIDSARQLIYSRSYADVGVQAICEHAEVKKGSFYHFFPSKIDLTLAVLDHIYIEFKSDLVGRAFANDIPPMQRFSRMAEMIYQFQKEIAESTGQILGCPFGNLSTEMSTQDEEIRLKINEIFDSFQDITKQTLIEAVELGEIGDIDVDATAEAMYAYLEGVMLMAKTRNNAELIKTLAPAVADIRIPPQG
ncbi:MAG: TetR/AcrR family transcriptional regulator [Gammaproteobacteria bacterium]|nr:TetR/AcrR family transcriptional regulator [Gammaproteobacteria bacterium]